MKKKATKSTSAGTHIEAQWCAPYLDLSSHIYHSGLIKTKLFLYFCIAKAFRK